MMKLDPARGHAEVRIDHRGLIDRTNATIEICAFVSNDRMVHSVYAITCLKKSRRSSSVGTSGLIVDCSHPELNSRRLSISGKTMNSTQPRRCPPAPPQFQVPMRQRGADRLVVEGYIQWSEHTTRSRMV